MKSLIRRVASGARHNCRPATPYGLTTGTVVVFDSTPFCFTTISNSPARAFDGLVKLIWYSPTPPGVRPANTKLAGCPSRVTVGGMVTVAGAGPDGAGWPEATAGLVAPSPVRYRMIVSPALAGFVESTSV